MADFVAPDTPEPDSPATCEGGSSWDGISSEEEVESETAGAGGPAWANQKPSKRGLVWFGPMGPLGPMGPMGSHWRHALDLLGLEVFPFLAVQIRVSSSEFC